MRMVPFSYNIAIQDIRAMMVSAIAVVVVIIVVALAVLNDIVD